jgi:hypothetical protein
LPSSVEVNQTSKCTSTVSGTGSFDPSVTWSVDNGRIDQSGNFWQVALSSGSGW